MPQRALIVTINFEEGDDPENFVDDIELAIEDEGFDVVSVNVWDSPNQSSAEDVLGGS